jgi:hypothetical protein
MGYNLARARTVAFNLLGMTRRCIFVMHRSVDLQ